MRTDRETIGAEHLNLFSFHCLNIAICTHKPLGNKKRQILNSNVFSVIVVVVVFYLVIKWRRMRFARHVAWLRGEKCIKICDWGKVRKQQCHIFGIAIEILMWIGCDYLRHNNNNNNNNNNNYYYYLSPLWTVVTITNHVSRVYCCSNSVPTIHGTCNALLLL